MSTFREAAFLCLFLFVSLVNAFGDEEWLLIAGDRRDKPIWGVIRLQSKIFQEMEADDRIALTPLGNIKLILTSVLTEVNITISEAAVKQITRVKGRLRGHAKSQYAWEWLLEFLRLMDDQKRGRVATIELLVDAAGDIPLGDYRRVFPAKMCRLILTDEIRHVNLVNLTNDIISRGNKYYESYGFKKNDPRGRNVGYVNMSTKGEQFASRWKDVIGLAFSPHIKDIRTDFARGLIWFRIPDSAGDEFQASLKLISQ